VDVGGEMTHLESLMLDTMREAAWAITQELDQVQAANRDEANRRLMPVLRKLLAWTEADNGKA